MSQQWLPLVAGTLEGIAPAPQNIAGNPRTLGLTDLPGLTTWLVWATKNDGLRPVYLRFHSLASYELLGLNAHPSRHSDPTHQPEELEMRRHTR